MVQVVERADIFGRIGKSLGEGVGEGAQEVAKKSALASGLDQLRSQVGQNANASPLDIYSQLLRTPFINPAMAGQLVPLIQQDLIASRSGGPLADAASEQVEPSGAPDLVPDKRDLQTPLDGPYVNQSEFYKNYGYDPVTMTPNELVDLQKKRPVIDPQTVENEAAKISASDRLRYPTIESARPLAQAKEQQKVDEFNATVEQVDRRHQLEERVRQSYDKRLQTLLQRSGNMDIYNDLPGELKDQFERLAINKAQSEGLSPDVAGKKAAQEAFDLVKTRNTLLTQSTGNFFTQKFKNKTKWVQNVRQARDKYAKLPGGREVFKNDLVTLGLSEPGASRIAFPGSSSTKQAIKNLPKRGLLTRFAGNLPQKLIPPSQETVQKFVKDLSKGMTTEDSIKSIQAQLHLNGHEPAIYLDAIREAYNDGKLSLNAMQSRELENLEWWKPSFEDIWEWSIQ